MADEKLPWYKTLTPKEVVLIAVFVASFLGYDTTVNNERFARGRQALQETQKQIDDLKKIIDELKKGQDEQLLAIRNQAK
jgi:uncharacterized membrane protein (DUF106 family)